MTNDRYREDTQAAGGDGTVVAVAELIQEALDKRNITT